MFVKVIQFCRQQLKFSLEIRNPISVGQAIKKLSHNKLDRKEDAQGLGKDFLHQIPGFLRVS
jgi:hypothetical protein